MKTFKVSEKNVNLTATFIFGSFSSKISFILAKSAREHTFLKNYGRGRDTISEIFKPFLLQLPENAPDWEGKIIFRGGGHIPRNKYHWV